MSLPDYTSDEFAQLLGSKTCCGPNAWKRLMTWLEIDQPFKNFMSDWAEQIAPTFHSDSEPEIDIAGVLELHFEHTYPAQFILRLAQMASVTKFHWLLSSLNEDQQSILIHWIRDSQLDRDKGFIADHWLESISDEELCYEGIPVYKPLTSEIFLALSKNCNPSSKRQR